MSAGAHTGYGRIATTTTAASSRLHQGCCGGDSSQDDDEDPSRLMRCKELLKTLKENQLEMLLSAVESYGAYLGSCVLVPRQRGSVDDHHRSYDQQHEQQQQYGGRPHRHHPRHFHHQRYRHYRHHRSRHHRSSSIEDEQESCSEESTSPMRSADERYCGKAGSGGGVVVPVRGGSSAVAESSAPSDPHLLCCQIWRWPDLEHSSELKRLPICHSAKDPVYICCNPYHWSRLCKPGE